MLKSGMFGGCGALTVDRCSHYYKSRSQTEHSVQFSLLLIVKMSDSRVEFEPVGLNLYLLVGKRYLCQKRQTI